MRKALLAPILFVLVTPQVGCGQSPSWSMLKQTIRTAYPEVRHVSTDTLAARLARGEAPLLLDARTEEEFRVSHLPNAHRVDPATNDADFLADLSPETPIVTYCSVGYRSAALAQRLREAGFTNVANLEGSLFAWANEGRPVYRDGEAARLVHPYDKVWGLLLKKELRAPLPPARQ